MAEVNLNDLNNSDSSKRDTVPEPITDFNPYVEEPLTMKKPRMFGRLFGRLSITENFEGAGQTILEEVVIPTLIDGLRDVIYTATDYILYGGGHRGSGRRGSGGRGNYTSYSKKSQQRQKGRKSAPASAAYYFTYDDRAEAQKDLDQMRDVVDQRDYVTIMDMFAIARRQTSNFMFNDWGWYDLRSALVRRTNDGRFYLDLPKPVPIEE